MIAIIGGGISGLALAHHLAARRLPFVLLEAAPRVGGVIRSARVDGHLLEYGPQRCRLTQDLAALVDELGLREHLITAPPDLPLFVYHTRRLRRVPFSAGAFFGSDVLSWTGKLRVLVEPLTRAPRDDESVAHCLQRKLGREAYEHLVGPLYGGLYASDPRDMIVGLSLRHALREFDVGRSLLAPLFRRRGKITPPSACSFRAGLEDLTRALFERHCAHILVRSAVRRIARAAGGYLIGTDTAEIEAEHVVISTPAHVAASLLRDVVPEAAGKIGKLTYNPLAVVHLLAETKLRGLGYQVSFAEPLVTRGVTWNDSLFDRTGVYTAYLGGALNPWVASASPERLARIAVREFRLVTGYDSRPLSIEREWMPAWDRSWSAITALRLPQQLHVHANWEARPGIAGRLLMARQLADRLERLR